MINIKNKFSYFEVILLVQTLLLSWGDMDQSSLGASLSVCFQHSVLHLHAHTHTHTFVNTGTVLEAHFLYPARVSINNLLPYRKLA